MHVPCDSNNALPFEKRLISKLASKLKEGCMISHHSRKPLLLYRDINEESNCAAEEEVCLLVENHVIILLYAYGGFIPSEFRSVGIYTIDKFMKSIIKKDRKDLLLQCLENLG